MYSNKVSKICNVTYTSTANGNYLKDIIALVLIFLFLIFLIGGIFEILSKKKYGSILESRDKKMDVHRTCEIFSQIGWKMGNGWVTMQIFETLLMYIVNF
jgi:hypothetical protein